MQTFFLPTIKQAAMRRLKRTLERKARTKAQKAHHLRLLPILKPQRSRSEKMPLRLLRRWTESVHNPHRGTRERAMGEAKPREGSKNLSRCSTKTLLRSLKTGLCFEAGAVNGTRNSFSGMRRVSTLLKRMRNCSCLR